MADAQYDADARDASGVNGADAFIRHALKRFTISAEAEASLRSKMLADKRFYGGEHWHPQQRREREDQDLPCLTIDRLKQPKRQITNSLMSSRPGIQVNPVDSYTDPKKAEAIQGLVRNVERQSHAEVVYATGLDDAVVCGRGFWRVDTPWAHDDQPDPKNPQGFFQREIRLLRIRNPFTVYPDPTCQEVDYRDARFYFVIEDVPRDEYLVRFPKSKACESDRWQGIGDTPAEWINEKSIRIAEYWYVEVVTATMALLRVPTIDPETQQPGEPQLIVMEKIPGKPWPGGVKEIDTRPVQLRRVKWACINALEILEGNDQKTAGRDWAGRFIPIVPRLGEEFDIGGRVDLRGIVRDAQDAQRVQNYEVSDLIEKQMLASKAPWIMAEGQDEGYEDQWAVANRKRLAYLKYKPKTHGSELLPPPFRNNFEPAIQATVVGIQQSEHWIYATTGFFEASVGAQGPEESGKAILARQRQGEIGSSHYAINFAHAIRFTGEIVIDLIPHTYDAERIERIIGPDDTERTVLFYHGQMPGNVDSLKQQGIADLYDVSTGKYDVVATAAPSKDTQRQEETELLSAVVQGNPQMMGVVGDLLFERMGTPAGRKMAERMRKAMPPHLQDQKDGPSVQQLQAQNQQLTQQLEQGMQAYQQLQHVIETKQVEAQAKANTEIAKTQEQAASDLQLAKLKADTDIRIAEIQANARLMELEAKVAGQASLARLEAALDEIAKRLDYDRAERTAGRVDARDDARQAKSDEREDTHRAEDREAEAAQAEQR